jgi:hypothetical protein
MWWTTNGAIEERDFMQVFTSVLNVPGPKIVNCLVVRRRGDWAEPNFAF